MPQPRNRFSLLAFLFGVFRLESVNFFVTNRVPRRLLTRLMCWYACIENRHLAKLSIALWKRFAPDLDLSEAKKSHFVSVQDCFIRELRDGARPIDFDSRSVCSPCDAIVGAHGFIAETRLFQVKGRPYTLEELLGDQASVDRYRNGKFVTLRLKSSMYHRFHAPVDCSIEEVRYFPGDLWNVNPSALKRVDKLFCKNERAAIDLRLKCSSRSLMLVPVGGILVSSIVLHFLGQDLRSLNPHASSIPCRATARKGEELGYFRLGSTIVLLATSEFSFVEGIQEGKRIAMGQALLLSDVGLSEAPRP